MNPEVRKYLIDQCVLGQPICYEDVAAKLSLNLSNINDRQILSNTLGEISAYEFSNGRPLISSIAIYKNLNDHGNGFYELCEELGIGKSSKLKKEFYGFTQIEKSKEFWKDEFNYQSFYEIRTPVYNEKDHPFINIDEIEFFRKWANRVYDKSNIDHYSAKEYLLSTVWLKTQFWSQEIVNRLENYETSNKRMWSKRDWQDGKRVSTFKPYTWARIFKNGDKEKDIFFTVGIDPLYYAIVYKLDFYRENDSKLSSKQKELCDQHIPKDLKWNEISEIDLQNWNWESLIKKIVSFISNNSHHYDQVVELVWGNKDVEKVFTNNLTLRDFPTGGIAELPKLNPSFKTSEVDFIKKNQEDKELGDFGEELVVDYERNKFKEKGLNSFIEKVKIEKDGKGYDITSFDENGNPLFIEVKTTRGNEKTPFFLSQNEILFFEKNKETYRIYRLYNYNEEKNYADFFIIENFENQLLFQPIEYRVYIKKK
jgi:hypothetical protein